MNFLPNPIEKLFCFDVMEFIAGEKFYIFRSGEIDTIAIKQNMELFYDFFMHSHKLQ